MSKVLREVTLIAAPLENGTSFGGVMLQAVVGTTDDPQMNKTLRGQFTELLSPEELAVFKGAYERAVAQVLTAEKLSLDGPQLTMVGDEAPEDK